MKPSSSGELGRVEGEDDGVGRVEGVLFSLLLFWGCIHGELYVFYLKSCMMGVMKKRWKRIRVGESRGTIVNN